ncbi:nuclear RNA export factor 2-like [Cephus cinctus]|uniref:Nuclear RNA export factor 2-like n=1 Tax=Cephus cinctus TaxID=211228 RepID=A0AAJ7C3X1_CEPCN|nr:nuclear RNA export factor 2-like [Cephus cinctus]XP_015601377.1 nuclear RNA export factor 2-like [Cephus cinctus]XP_015601380.1 nuclear RNA export factor 2-like [Cephus cinctus]XP_015601381.1 nuclear RNA export factor 2-like [Cephus cinctus]
MTSTVLGNRTSWEPLRLTHLKPSFNSTDLALASRQDVWHKFIVFDAGKYDKEEVLIAIILACDPEVLLPVMYKVENNNKGTFLTKCTSGVIENLVKQNLSVKLKTGHILKIDIVLGFLGMQDLHLNPHNSITQTLHYKYESVKKILNLDDFQNEKSLGSIYCPISVPRVLLFVLRCAKVGILGNIRETRLPIRELSLRWNGLEGISLFEKFFNYHLTKLDLRHNQITDINSLRYFSEFKITELWLDGNPLCTKYTSPEDYIRGVRNVFRHLQKLDGIVIGVQRKLVPIMQSNYLGDSSRFGLIKQFVRHFFTLYDQDDRIVMKGLYDKNAFYSMTLGSGANYNHKQIAKVFSSNRNLLKFVDYAKCHEFLLQGPEQIISMMRKQPPTTHHLRTFHVDLLNYGESHIAIAVQGVFHFKDFIPPLMTFNRTFILIAKVDNEYNIINDQYHIDMAPPNVTGLDNNSAKLESREAPKISLTVLSPSEKNQLLGFLHELTTMNTAYCQQFLENARWDIRVAINTFMKAYTVNDIPPEAFK